MAFHIEAVTLIEAKPHAFLKDRFEARALGRVREFSPAGEFTHHLTVRVRLQTIDSMTQDRIQTALLVRARRVLARSFARASRRSVEA